MTQHDHVAAEVLDLLGELLDQLGTSAELAPSASLKEVGFDSLTGLEFACEIERRLGISVPEDANPFVADSKHRLRTVSELIEFIRKLASRGDQ